MTSVSGKVLTWGSTPNDGQSHIASGNHEVIWYFSVFLDYNFSLLSTYLSMYILIDEFFYLLLSPADPPNYFFAGKYTNYKRCMWLGTLRYNYRYCQFVFGLLLNF